MFLSHLSLLFQKIVLRSLLLFNFTFYRIIYFSFPRIYEEEDEEEVNWKKVRNYINYVAVCVFVFVKLLSFFLYFYEKFFLVFFCSCFFLILSCSSLDLNFLLLFGDKSKKNWLGVLFYIWKYIRYIYKLY